jgi:drug/metabolite transporter (DMT)-like permease
VLIKIGPEDIPPLAFAGLRQIMAILCLLPLVIRSGQLTPLRGRSRSTRARLIALGLLFYTATQGAVFLSLFHLPALTVSLLLSFSPVLVALLGIILLRERSTLIQWAGTGLHLVGVLVYLYPASLPDHQVIGLIVTIRWPVCSSASTFPGSRCLARCWQRWAP